MPKSKQQRKPAQPSKEKQQPILDPSDPTLYPEQSGSEIEEIIKHATTQAERYTHNHAELADCYVTIMRLAAHVRTLEGPQ